MSCCTFPRTDRAPTLLVLMTVDGRREMLSSAHFHQLELGYGALELRNWSDVTAALASGHASVTGRDV
jgi:hypothetical protein